MNETLAVDVTELADEGRPRLGDKSQVIARSARQSKREQAARDRTVLESGLWPGFWLTREERPGRHIAIVALSSGRPHQYTRRESFARFTTADDAERAARDWLKRLTVPR
jgi:hypothetical protein